MSERVHVIAVGAPDPELRNSPVIEDTDYEYPLLAAQMPETGVCYFNGASYGQGSEVCSGNERLRCEQGAWLREGSCDQDNP
ncbi:MAG: hypothetical protein HY272_11685 [Gammaproteobacteria bacterium]|nr:hypothetical protein [Gammaproteobacteria bacterium]